MILDHEGKQLTLFKFDYGAERAKLQEGQTGAIYNMPMKRLGRYWLFMSDSIEGLNGERLLGVFDDNKKAMIKMREAADSMNYRDNRYWRFSKISNKMTAIDFGSWSKFGILIDFGE